MGANWRNCSCWEPVTTFNLQHRGRLMPDHKNVGVRLIIDIDTTGLTEEQVVQLLNEAVAANQKLLLPDNSGTLRYERERINVDIEHFYPG